MNRKNSSHGIENVIDVAFMGPARTGKSCVIQRLIDGQFRDEYEPTVFDLYDYESKVDNKCRLCLKISDTAGSFHFPAMDRLTIQKSDVVVLVFDLAYLESFNKVCKIASEIKSQDPKKPIIIVGNKVDLNDRISSRKELQQYVICTLQHAYLEMSAKYSTNNANELLKKIFEEYELSNGPYKVHRSYKPISGKLKRKFSGKSRENLFDIM